MEYHTKTQADYCTTMTSKRECLREREASVHARWMTLMWVMTFCWLGLDCHVDAAALGISRREAPNARKLVLHNKSGRRVDLLWINRHTNPVSFQSNSENGEGYPYGASQGINTFVGHEFEIREMPSKKTGQCKDPGNCRTGYVRVNGEEGQKITIDKEFNVKHEDDRTVALEQAEKILNDCESSLTKDQLDPLILIDAITECMEKKVNETLGVQEEERAFQSQLRHKMATELVPYACGDPTFQTSEEVFNRTWTFTEVEGTKAREFQLQSFHERPGSTILQIPNFARPEECEALQFFINDGKHIPFDALSDMTKQGQLINTLANKMYRMTQAVMGWDDLDLNRQYKQFGHNFLDILQDVSGFSVMSPCTTKDLELMEKEKIKVNCRLPGSAYPRVPTRHFVAGDANHVATAFLFCNQDEVQQLGGMNFPDAGVHINPRPNLLVLAVHQSLHEEEKDEFTSNYHFCPNYNIMTHTFLHEKEKASEERQKYMHAPSSIRQSEL